MARADSGRAVLTGLGVGAGLMYLFDPVQGRRRRALVGDRLAHTRRLTGDAAGATARDVAHRATGLAARVRGAVRPRPGTDDVVAARVRAKLGRLVSHPRAVDVEVQDGVVTLRGPILTAEARRLLHAVERLAGVRDVVNQLEAHDEAGAVPALQGGRPRPGVRPEILQRQWSPTTRALTGAAGTALAGYGVSRRDLPGALLAAAGVGLAARALTNLDARRLFGIGAGRRAVDIQKTITIDAPVEQVYEFWSDYQNFPKFMTHVREVRAGARERVSHWLVEGPGGIPVEFDSEISASVPDKVLAWRTVEGAPVAHAGIVQFDPVRDGRTRVHIRMSYNPPGGWFGHNVFAAFGADPKRILDEDLVRMKTLIEAGRPPHDAAKPAGNGAGGEEYR